MRPKTDFSGVAGVTRQPIASFRQDMNSCRGPALNIILRQMSQPNEQLSCWQPPLAPQCVNRPGACT